MRIDAIGYQIPSSFNRQFKAAFGKTSPQYRAEYWKQAEKTEDEKP